MLNIYKIVLHIETEKILYLPAPDINTALQRIKGQKFSLHESSSWNHTIKLVSARAEHAEVDPAPIKLGQEVFVLNPETIKIEQGTVVDIIENGTIINSEKNNSLEVQYSVTIHVKTMSDNFSFDFYKDLNQYVFLSLEDMQKHLFSNIED